MLWLQKFVYEIIYSIVVPIALQGIIQPYKLSQLNLGTPTQAWDWVLPIKTEIFLSSGAAVSLLGGLGACSPKRFF